MFSKALSFLSSRNVNIHGEMKNEWKRVLVDLNMQVACNVREAVDYVTILLHFTDLHFLAN